MRYITFNSAPPGLARGIYAAMLNSPLTRGRAPLSSLLSEEPDMTLQTLSYVDYSARNLFVQLFQINLDRYYLTEEEHNTPVKELAWTACQRLAQPSFVINGPGEWRRIKGTVVEQIETQLELWDAPMAGRPDFSLARNWKRRARVYNNRVMTYSAIQRAQLDNEWKHVMSIKELEV